jgi:virulence factor Mce-like protein
MAGNTEVRKGPIGWVIDHPWSVILLVGVLALGLWVKSTRSSEYEVSVMFEEAVSLYSGLDVRVDGLDAGKIKSVEQRDGGAVVTLGLTDDDVFPLHQGTTATLRFGTTIGNGTRQIDLEPGPASAPQIPDGGIIPAKDAVGTTEFDQVFDTLDGRTRKDLQQAMEGTGRTFGPRERQVGAAVDTSAEGLAAVGDFATDLAADTPALRAFVSNTDRVTSTLGQRRAALSSLIGTASATFDEFAAGTDGITDSLDRLPGAQREARQTLARLDTSVRGLDQLVADVRPGARELAGLSRDLRPALAELRRSVPIAVATLRTGRRTAPEITGLLKQAETTAPKASAALDRAAPMVACVRPYAPEIAGLMSTWSSFPAPYDGTTHVGRIMATVAPSSVTSTQGITAKEYVALGLNKFALVRPPGMNAGKPRFLPECGITDRFLDANRDPEAGK